MASLPLVAGVAGSECGLRAADRAAADAESPHEVRLRLVHASPWPREGAAPAARLSRPGQVMAKNCPVAEDRPVAVVPGSAEGAAP
ncbi:hypothetical protein ABZ119_01060 [Streptomyces sp. NPDC006288]|uniref:hypothetical protein n=1 Tax=Streptomyces sp. NPDC006288 TaxID=3156743 RepID=UPI0033B6FEE6